MRYFIFVMLALANVSVSFAKGENPFGTSYQPYTDPPSRLSLSLIKDKLNSHDPFQSVENFLRWARKEDPNHLRHFTFMRKSRSLQEASDSHPRAIVYGSDAKFIFAFNGDPSQQGYNHIEMIQFHPQTSGQGAHLEFRELVFTSDRAELSAANPPKCMQCHSTSLHHLWDPYENWQGSYGERDDGILNQSDKYVFGGQTQDIIDLYNKEFGAYQTFLSHRLEHPRYRELNYPEGSPVSPYSPTHRGERRFRPNLRLTKLLTELQSQLMLSRLSSNEKCFWDWAYLLEAQLINCQNEPDFARKMQSELNRAFLLLQKKYPKPNLEVSWSRFEGNTQVHPIATYFRLLGAELSDWSLQFLADYWSYFEGERYQHQIFAEALYHLLQKQNPSLPEATSTKEACQALLTNHFSREKNNNHCISFRPFPDTAGQPATVQMCASCHENGSRKIPQFQINDPKMRSEILNRIATPSAEKQMPPQRPLNERERKELTDYLNR